MVPNETMKHRKRWGAHSDLARVQREGRFVRRYEFRRVIDVLAIDPGGRVPPELELIDIEVMIDCAGRSQRPVLSGSLRAAQRISQGRSGNTGEEGRWVNYLHRPSQLGKINSGVKTGPSIIHTTGAMHPRPSF